MKFSRPNFVMLLFAFLMIFVLTFAYFYFHYYLPYQETQTAGRSFQQHELEVSPTPISQFCGGIANIRCPSNFKCQLDGSYPDAGGHCVGLVK